MTATWRELQSDADALPMIRDWIAASPVDVKVLPASPEDGRRCLEALQVTTRSPMGAVAFHTGGLLVDHGWLRVLGAGSAALPRSLDLWNAVGGSARFDRGVLIADDVLGGFFAWFREPRTVHYLAPDTLEWEDSQLGYADWLAWALTERLRQFYEDLRWEGWSQEIATLRGESGLLIYPPLFSEASPVAERKRSPVPMEELWRLGLDFQRQLKGVTPGTRFRIDVVP